MNQIFNFSAGPAMLPKVVLKQAQNELCNWRGLGTSIMEISHRGKEFIQMTEEIKSELRCLLNITTDYKILLCHGGGRSQFSAIPLNLLGKRNTADYVNTGYWANNAAQEAKRYCTPNIIDVKITVNDLCAIKSMNEWELSCNSAYMHYCPNETIDGITIYETPSFNSEIIVIADCSSIILSTPLNIQCYGMIYAGTQKNIGPAGLTIVIIREDLLGKAHKMCPSILNYTTLNKYNSMFNTPSTFSWYLIRLVLKWLRKQGGVAAIDIINKKKAELLYTVIDESNLYYNTVAKTNRSCMNIPFYLVDNTLNELFLRESFAAGLHGLQGHRIAGGMRASIYNAMPLEGVKALTKFMIEFERRYG